MEKAGFVSLGIKYLNWLSTAFNSRVFLTLGTIAVFFCIVFENMMSLVNLRFGPTFPWVLFWILPFSTFLFLISAFTIAVKKRWADLLTGALLFLALILHRPAYAFEFEHHQITGGLATKIWYLPFNYSFYLICAGLIVFLIVQIKNKNYRIILK